MAIYYIKPAANGGSDSNNGLSSSTAWATLGKALGTTGMSSGDTVYIAPGTYRETITVTMTVPTAETFILGDPKATKFPDISPGHVRITSHTTDTTVGTIPTFNINGRDNLTIENLYMDFYRTANVNSQLLGSGTGSFGRVTINNIKIRRCVFFAAAPIQGGGIAAAIDLQGTNFLIERCVTNGNGCCVFLNNLSSSYGVTVSNCVLNGEAYGTSINVNGPGFKIYNNICYNIQIASTGSASYPHLIYNNFLNAISSSSTDLQIEDYNRFVVNGTTKRTNVTAGANSLYGAYEGFDRYASIVQGFNIYQKDMPLPGSTFIGAGTATPSDIPTTDILGNPWTGSAPNIGPFSTKSLSNPQYIASDSVVNIRQNTTSRTEFINLNSVGYRFNTATLVASYIKLGGTRTSIPLVNQTVTGAWVSGGFVEIDPVNMPGLYRFDVPDTVFLSSASAIQIINTANSDKATITYKFTQEYKIDLTQAVPQINVPNTVGDALNAARAGTFGGMTIGNKELNYYSPTNAIIKTFTVDSNTYIRSKKEKNFIPYDGLKLYLDAGKGLSYSGTGSNWVDLSGNYNNGFLTNGPAYISANEGIISFDGTNDFISFNSQPISSSAFTIILNFRVSSFTNQGTKYRRLIAINQSGYTFDNPFAFFVNDTGKLGYLFGNGSTNTEEMLTITGGPTLEINKWYHATLTFNGTQKKLYIGGNLVSTIANTTTFTNSLNNKLIIGSRNGTDGCMQGAIGTVHVYDRALSDSEVMTNYAIYSSRYVSGIVTSGLMLYVDPDNVQSYPGTGNTIYNLVGTSYNGVLNNGASFGTDSSGGYIATDGTNDYVKFPLTRSTVPYTVFVFARILGSGRLISDDTNWLMGNWQGNQNAYHANGWVWNSGGPTGNGWRSHCTTGDFAADNWKIFVNGVKLTENNGGGGGFTNITWGIWNSSSEPCAGNFGVFLVYDRVLTDAEVLQNHEALRGRYGI
jgi:hypothetical protein